MAVIVAALLHRMEAAIVNVPDPDKVILFGSRGRGDAGAHSDVDLVVIEAEPFGVGRDRRGEATRLWRAVGNVCRLFTPQECVNHLVVAGYDRY